jgi:NADPH2:quinone reductase
LFASGKIRPIVHAVLPAADAAQAHAMMEASHHVGKIVLTWDAL